MIKQHKVGENDSPQWMNKEIRVCNGQGLGV